MKSIFSKLVFIGIIAQILFPLSSLAQESKSVPWLTFEQLEDSLKSNPKPVFIEFYADWCTACKRMERDAFRNVSITVALSNDYYAVRMNVETTDSITCGGQVFVNENSHKINAVHQIPLLMASRKDAPFSLPAMVILDEHFEAKARYFQYLSAGQLEKILAENH